jgi:hypothetical protein
VGTSPPNPHILTALAEQEMCQPFEAVAYRVMGLPWSRSGRMPARAGRPTRETYSRSLEHFLTFTRDREGRVARVSDLNAETIQA